MAKRSKDIACFTAQAHSTNSKEGRCGGKKAGACQEGRHATRLPGKQQQGGQSASPHSRCGTHHAHLSTYTLQPGPLLCLQALDRARSGSNHSSPARAPVQK